MPLEFTTSFLADSIALFQQYKGLADRAIAQASDEHLTATLDAEMNSIAIIIQHLAGNMRSRWVDFLSTDGEKPTRDRDAEFEAATMTRAELLALWETGWACLFAAITPLAETDLQRKITIRGEAHSVLQAINRQVAHYAYHCGQIVLLAKHFQSAQWQSLSVPRRQSQDYTRRVRDGKASQR